MAGNIEQNGWLGKIKHWQISATARQLGDFGAKNTQNNTKENKTTAGKGTASTWVGGTVERTWKSKVQMGGALDLAGTTNGNAQTA